jgi:hypothetical protein
MCKPQTCRTVAVVLLLLGTFGQGAARADYGYSLSVSTSTISGLSGYLDFQLNPGSSNAKALTATITNFQKVGGTLAQTSTNTGNATGTLPSTLTLTNSTTFNDIFQGFTFGSSFSLVLTLSGPAINNPGGTTGSAFALTLYGADQTTTLLSNDAVSGSLLTINVNPNGTASVQNFSTGAPPVLTVTPLGSSVPEPSSLLLGLVGGGLLAGAAVLTRGWRGGARPSGG